MGDSISVITTKACSTCKQVKDLSMFCKDKKSPNGYRYDCKSCNQEYRKENREKLLAYERTDQRRIRNKERYQTQRRDKIYVLRGLLREARKRARNNELPFDLTMEWLKTMVVSHCPITLQPIDWLKEQVVNRTAGPNSPSIDKNKPELGYVQSNCSIISHRGNLIKSNGTVDEHRRVVQYMAAQQLRDTEF